MSQVDLTFNDTCAQVHPTATLVGEAAYRLRLPKGVRYNPLSGALKAEVSVKVYGLRRFALPLRQDFATNVDPKTAISYGSR